MAHGLTANWFREPGKENAHADLAVVVGSPHPHHHNLVAPFTLNEFFVVEVRYGIGTRSAVVGARSAFACRFVARPLLALVNSANAHYAQTKAARMNYRWRCLRCIGRAGTAVTTATPLG
jgi:hypothetical protein